MPVTRHCSFLCVFCGKFVFTACTTLWVTHLSWQVICIIIIIITSSPQSHLGRVRRSRTNTQQSPHWLQWDAPNSPPKLPLPIDVHHPIEYTHQSTDTTHHVKWHSDPISHFATVHSGPPDTQTERWARRQLDSIRAYARYSDREQRGED